MKRFSICIGLLFLAVGSTGCSGDFSEAKEVLAQSRGNTITGQTTLISKLRATGASVAIVGEVDQPFLSVTGTMFKVQGEDVQVFEYSSATELEAQAKLISRDGTTVGTTKIHWIGSPHFFKQERVLVLYVGDDRNVLKSLEAVLGRQFAGQ